MDYVIWNDGTELYHHGIPGQKWGVRRWQNEDGSLTPEGRIRYGYQTARAEFRDARRNFRRSAGSGFGAKGIRKYEKARKVYDKAEDKYIKAKVDYAKVKNGEKGEYKTYRREMWKSGLPGSAADTQYGGRSTRLYNNIVKAKGEEYADAVLKSVQNQAVGMIVGAVAMEAGLLYMQYRFR